MTPHSPLEQNAVDGLLTLLPITGPLRAIAARDLDGPRAGVAAAAISRSIQASFVGAQSADLAIAVVDDEHIRAAGGGDSRLVSAADVLRPSLEAAASAFGDGLLGTSSIGDAASLFGDDSATVFELLSGPADEPVGWFAVRLRDALATPKTAKAPVSDSDVIGKLGRINNVEMALTVELGRTRMTVHDVLSIEPGAVIELDRSAGAPADVLLNGRLIAHGEIVVVDQDYAVRITRILDVADGTF